MDSCTRRRLGKRLSRHRTDNPNNPWVAWAIAALGAAGVVLLLWREESGPVLALPFGALLGGSIGGTMSLRQRDERFVLYENGLVHLRGQESRIVFWSDITQVSNHRESHSGGGMSRVRRRLGYDVWCRIKVRQGSSLLITAFTERAVRLAGAVESAWRREAQLPQVTYVAPSIRKDSWKVRTRGGALVLTGLLLVLLSAAMFSVTPEDPEAEWAVTLGLATALLLPGLWCTGRGLRRACPWRAPRPAAGQGWTRNAWSVLYLGVGALLLGVPFGAEEAGWVWPAALWGLGAVLLMVLSLRASWRDGDHRYWRALVRGGR